MSRGEIQRLKLVKAHLEIEALEHELINHIKGALENVVTLNGLYEIREHIDQLLLSWEQLAEEDSEDEIID